MERGYLVTLIIGVDSFFPAHLWYIFNGTAHNNNLCNSTHYVAGWFNLKL